MDHRGLAIRSACVRLSACGAALALATCLGEPHQVTLAIQSAPATEELDNGGGAGQVVQPDLTYVPPVPEARPLADDFKESPNLDPWALKPVEYTMRTARISKLPVEQAFVTSHWTDTSYGSGTYSVSFRAQCLPAYPETHAEDCDPIIFARMQKCPYNSSGSAGACSYDVAFNDDSALAGGATTSGSYVTFEVPVSSSVYYKLDFVLVVANRIGGEAKLDIAHGAAGAWSTNFYSRKGLLVKNGAGQWAGGAVVDVGPLAAGDSLQVLTPQPLDDNNRTDLYLFNPWRDKFVAANSTPTGGPVLRIPDSSWAGGGNYLVVSKSWRRTDFQWRGLQAIVELQHGPMARAPIFGGYFDATSDNCSGTMSDRRSCLGAGATITTPGRYQAIVTARVDATSEGPVGSTSAIGYQLGWGNQSGHFLSESDDPSQRVAAWYRGMPNDLAFDMYVLRRRVGTLDSFVAVAARKVPRAVLGSSFDWQRVYLDFEVPSGGYEYSVLIERSGVTLRGNTGWRYWRNPDVLELKAAQFNVEYGEHNQKYPGAIQNVALFLGGRGDIVHTYSDVYLENQYSRIFEWDADIISLQELLRDSSEGDSVDEVGETLTNFSFYSSRPPYGWMVAHAPQKFSDYSGGYPSWRYSALLANEWATNGQPMIFPDKPSEWCGSTGSAPPDTLFPGTEACRLVSDSTAYFWDEEWYSLPTSIHIKALGGAAKPVTLVSAYLPDEASMHAERVSGYQRLAAILDYLIQKQPLAFNPDGNTSPKWFNNRIIILGDHNLKNSQGAESNTLLEIMRAKFGYAVDVAQAAVDDRWRVQDMHYGGRPLNEYVNFGSGYGACANLPVLDSEATACAYGSMSEYNWRQLGDRRDDNGTPLPNSMYDPNVSFNWWAGSSQGPGGSSRLDVIFLVGRGWENDDPVLLYKSVPTIGVPSFANGYRQAGVEMGPPGWCLDGSEPGRVADGWSNYNPRELVVNQEGNSCGRGYGKTAFQSDHKPIGARLRIMGEESLALRRPAQQSSDYAGGVASRAVDGNTDGDWSHGSVTHTDNQDHAWWKVDLGATYSIGHVRVWNRTDCCADRLSDFNVKVSNDGINWTSMRVLGEARTPTVADFDGKRGRWVMIELTDKDYLSLAEVQVFSAR